MLNVWNKPGLPVAGIETFAAEELNALDDVGFDVLIPNALFWFSLVVAYVTSIVENSVTSMVFSDPE